MMLRLKNFGLRVRGKCLVWLLTAMIGVPVIHRYHCTLVEMYRDRHLNNARTDRIKVHYVRVIGTVHTNGYSPTALVTERVDPPSGVL